MTQYRTKTLIKPDSVNRPVFSQMLQPPTSQTKRTNLKDSSPTRLNKIAECLHHSCAVFSSMQQEIRAKIYDFTLKLVKKRNIRSNRALIFTQSGEYHSLFPYFFKNVGGAFLYSPIFSKMLEVNMKNKIVNRKLRDGNQLLATSGQRLVASS